MGDNNGRKLFSAKVIIIILSVLLALSIAALGYVVIKNKSFLDTSVSGDNIITNESESQPESVSTPIVVQNGSSVSSSFGSESDAAVSDAEEGTSIFFSTEKNEDVLPFSVENMFPGDSYAKIYTVNVSHKNDVTLHFRADIRPGYEKLAEVLMIKITDLSSSEALYDGLMRDMPQSVERVLSGADRSSSVTYETIAYLNTSVTNEYMNQQLCADFRWWIEEQDLENLDNPPKTFDIFDISVPVIFLVASALVFIIIKRRRRVNESD